mgnify:FL=1
MNEYVKLETRDDHILLVTLNRPDKRNAINSEMIDNLETVMRRLHEETYASIGCVVISGAGGNFSAGRDLKDLEAAAGESLADRRKRYHRLKSFADSFEQCPVPVIAAVEGYALGLAAGIVTWCDMAVMGEQAKFGYPEAKKGVLPGFSSMELKKRVPKKISFELLIAGKILTAREAERLFLVNRVVPDDRVLPEALELAAALVANGAETARLLKQYHQMLFAETSRLEMDYSIEMMAMAGSLRAKDASKH